MYTILLSAPVFNPHPLDLLTLTPSSPVIRTSMVAYLWLVWYDSATKAAPRHWALAVTYETHDNAYATFYEVSDTLSATRDSGVLTVSSR